MTLGIDHVISCVTDLSQADRRFREEFGLTSALGGRHRGHGTANRIVPLGEAYLELVSVVDPAEARNSPFGGWVARNSARPGLHAVVIRTDDIDEVCRRLDLTPLEMSRSGPDGVELHWAIAGLELMLGEGLPSFIQWQVDDSLLPGRTPVAPANPTGGFDEVVLRGPVQRLRDWTAGCPGIRVLDGEPGVASATVQSIELA